MINETYINIPKKNVKKSFCIDSDQQKMLTDLANYFQKTESEVLRFLIEQEWKITNFWELYGKDDICGK